MAGFVPLRVEHIYINDIFECEGYSPQFKEIEQGIVSPLYQLVITIDDNDEILSSQFEEEID